MFILNYFIIFRTKKTFFIRILFLGISRLNDMSYQAKIKIYNKRFIFSLFFSFHQVSLVSSRG